MRKEEVLKLLFSLMQDDCEISLSKHARKRMGERHISLTDIQNVLETTDKYIHDGEYSIKDGAFSYAVETRKFRVVISFGPEGDYLVIVTVIRKE